MALRWSEAEPLPVAAMLARLSLMQATLPLRRSIVVDNHLNPGECHPGRIRQRDRSRGVCDVGVLSRPRLVETMVAAAAMADARLTLAGRWYPETCRDVVAAGPG